MTSDEKSFEAALRERLRERARTLLATDQAVVKQLVSARQRITELLAGQPTDYKRWQLARLLDQVEAVLAGAAGNAATAADSGLRELWQQGEDFIDKPLAAAGIALEQRLPLLDVQQLQAMRTFTGERLKNVGAEAKGKIGAHLGRVIMGVETPFEAIRSIQATLGDEMPRRATTIVRTEAGQVFAVASQQRLAQAAELDDRMEKQWRRSGKIHSRWNHDLVDGQRVAANKPFRVPSDKGGIDLMQHPHDPRAPASQNINCGCVSLPQVKGWGVMTPGAKPFTEREIKLDPRKAALDKMAKATGVRDEKPQQAPPNTAYAAAQAGGKHAGYLRQVAGYGPNQSRKAVASHTAQIALHQDKVQNPERYVPDWAERRPEERDALLRGWRQEVVDRQAQIDIIQGHTDGNRDGKGKKG